MSDRNERVRALLQEGDPAAGEPGLSVEEVQAMRRTVLTAVPEARRRGWLIPALATAALVIAVAIGFSLWPYDNHTTSKPDLVAGGRRPLPRVSVGEGRGGGVVARPEGTPPLPSPASQEREPPPSPKRTIRDEAETALLARTEPPVAEPVIAEGPQQIQFSTPGGTRVIWMLNPATE
jgi:hypothetical protein